MGCSREMLISILMVTNCLALIAGSLALIFAAMDNEYLTKILEGQDLENLQKAKILMQIVGTCMIIISFIGCFGVFFDSKPYLVVYMFLLMILFVLAVSGVSIIFIVKNSSRDKLEGWMDNYFNKYENGTVVEKSWNIMQEQLECCGVRGWYDWEKSGKPIPESCCKGNTTACVEYPESGDNIYQKGCHEVILNLLQNYSDYILAGVIITSIFMVVCFGASCILVKD